MEGFYERKTVRTVRIDQLIEKAALQMKNRKLRVEASSRYESIDGRLWYTLKAKRPPKNGQSKDSLSSSASVPKPGALKEERFHFSCELGLDFQVCLS